MTTILTKATLALALGASALTMAAPADAQRYGDRRGHDGTGTAIIAGIAGLAIGAAIVSSANHRREARDDARYYGDDGYYDDGYRYRNEGYGDDDDGWRPRCHVESRWDGYAEQRVLVRVCR